MPTDPQVAIGGKTVLFFVLKEPLNGFSDFGVRGRLSMTYLWKLIVQVSVVLRKPVGGSD